MTGELSTYSEAGVSVPDQVAVQLRRLSGMRHVNVWDFMTAEQVADAKTLHAQLDMTAAIQAAIDYAYANNIHAIYLPGGRYKITSSLYLDPPTSLRMGSSSFAQFSLALFGDKGPPNEEGTSYTQIIMATSDFVGLWVGPGQGMYVGNLVVRGDYLNKSQIGHTSGGVFLAGGGGGSSKCTIDNVGVSNVWVAYSTGGNGVGSMSEQNTFFRCFANNCDIGFRFPQTQNFINTLYDCGAGARVCVQSEVGCNVNVIGGNYSCVDGKVGFVPVSGTTGFTNLNVAFATPDVRFTTTVSASVPAGITDGRFDHFAFETVSHGVVPAEKISYDAGTRQLTLRILTSWLAQYYSAPFCDYSMTSLFTEIAAVTNVAACERHYIFSGGSIKAYGIHLESPLDVVTLVKSYSAFSNERAVVLKDIYLNFDVSASYDTAGARYLCQVGVPFIDVVSASVYVDNIRLNASEAVNIDIAAPTYQCVINRVQQPTEKSCPSFNVRQLYVTRYDELNVSRGSFTQTMFRGWGDFEQQYNGPIGLGGRNGAGGVYPSGFSAPHRGFAPAPYTVPRTTPAQIDSLVNGSYTVTNHDMLHAESIYSVLNQHDSVQRQYLFARNIGVGYTYGSDLSIPWQYRASSAFLYLTGANAFDNMKYFFPGLVLVLNNGSGDSTYMVTGVFRYKTMVAVAKITNNESAPPTLDGTKGQQYTGSTIKQVPYRVRKYGRQCEFASAAPSSGTWDVGDIVYSTQPAVTGFVGWVCTVAGTPGTWKTYGAVSP